MKVDEDQLQSAHAHPAHEVLASLGSTAQGLSSAQAAARLAQYGPNALPQARSRPPWLRFLEQFNSALIYFLLAAALGAALLGHAVDAGAIVAVVLINALVGYIQEGKAEKALAAMQRMIAPPARCAARGLRIDEAPAPTRR